MGDEVYFVVLLSLLYVRYFGGVLPEEKRCHSCHTGAEKLLDISGFCLATFKFLDKTH